MRVILVSIALFICGCSNSPAASSRSKPPSTGGDPSSVVGQVDAGTGGVGNDEVEEQAGAPSISLAFADAVLPPAKVNQRYEYTFKAAGGTGPVSFQTIADSLPKGLSLSPEGLLSGTPSAAGEFTLKVNATVPELSVAATFHLEVIRNAWLAYRSDDRTPAVNELFAVNTGLKPPYASVVVSHPLGQGEQVTRAFSWSPDGWFLAYTAAQAGSTGAYLVDMRGLTPGAPVSLSALFGRTSTGEIDLHWAPSGKALLVRDQVGSFLVDLNASQLTSRPIPAGKDCWRWTPDSQQLLCRDGGTSVIALPLDLSAPRTLTGHLAVSYGNLTPDGTSLVFDGGTGDGLLYFSRLADNVPYPRQLNPVPVGRRTSYSWVDNQALVYVASNVSLYEHEICRASYGDPPRVETLVKGIDTSATGMDSRDILPQLLPGGKLLAYQSPGYEEGTWELNVRELATGKETSKTVGPGVYVITSEDGKLILLRELWKGGDLLTRCKLADDGLQQCIDLNSAEPGFEIRDAVFSPKNDGALFMGGAKGQLQKAFYADMRGDVRQAVPLHGEGDATTTIASTAFSPDGSKLFLRLKSSTNTSLYLIDLQGQRPSAPLPVSGKGLVTTAAWQPAQTPALVWSTRSSASESPAPAQRRSRSSG